LLALLPLTFAGTVFWFLNPEATAVLFVSTGGLHPVAVGMVAAVGQSLAHLVMWAGGARLQRSGPWFDRHCQRAHDRWGPRLARSTLPLVAASGLFGVPPASATALLAPGLGLRRNLVLPLLFVGRAIRFTTLGLLAAGLLEPAGDPPRRPPGGALAFAAESPYRLGGLRPRSFGLAGRGRGLLRDSDSDSGSSGTRIVRSGPSALTTRSATR
jgi:membrane protein YqaA with SNARE-associated domain